MGNLITWAAAPPQASWTNVYIYSAIAQGGPFTLLTTLAYSESAPVTVYYHEAGTTATWYEISWYDSVSQVESAKTSPFQAESATTTYTTPARVAARLQIRNSQGQAQFDGTTHPDIQEVIEMIQEVEDRIDRETGHAWRERYAYDTGDANAYEQKNLNKRYIYLAGIPVFLDHRHIRQIDTNKGDQILVFNGKDYDDWVTTKTEGRGNDWWLDYTEGVIWFRTYIYRNRPYGLKMRYRYGETSVPGDVTRAATYITAADIVRLDDRAFLLPEGGQGVPLVKKADDWEMQAEELLQRLKEFPVGSY